MHLDGIPFRKIADQVGKTLGSTYRKYEELVSKIPDNNLFTRKHCNRWSGILVVDGKYIKVKGYDQKIALIWGIDFLTHDIPIFVLAPNENYEACKKYFTLLKEINYSLQIVICDDNINTKQTAREINPKVRIQTCTNHYLENIRRDLKYRTEDKYKPFINDLKRHLFTQKLTQEIFLNKLAKIYEKYKTDDICVNYLRKINDDTEELIAANYVINAPMTTNIIESYNSHLQGRLKSIKGFESYKSAKDWINAYILRRRFKPFTDCRTKFRILNGKSSISESRVIGQQLPNVF